MKLRYLIPVAAFAILIAFFVHGLSRDPSVVPSPFIGKRAPSFELPALLDPERTVSTADFAGGPALLNVWATWCVECQHEHDFLLTLAGRGEIPIYGLNWQDQRAPAIEWLDTLGNPYVATGYDPDGSVGIDWGVYGAPETFLIGPDGTVLFKHVSPLTEAIWQQEFVPRIEAATAASGE